MSQPEHDVDVAHTYPRTQAELTTTSQSEDSLSPPASPTFEDHQEEDGLHQSDTLTFPTLESDGSLPDLREARTLRSQTPPAALSSFGARARMAGNTDMQSSIDSLDDHYDMIDDLSEISTTDGRETASLASTDRAVSDDEGELTPEEENDEEGVDIEFNAGSVGDLAGTLGHKADQSTAEANRVIDSYMTDDLETPRQSLIRPSASSTETASPPTTTPSITPSKQESTPASIQVLLYCLHKADAPRVAPNIGARLATCIGSGQLDTGEVIRLPSTPDNSQGSLLCRYENLNITIDHVNLHTSRPSTIVIPKHQEADLVVVYLSDFEEFPRDFVEGVAHATYRYAGPMFVITKTREEKKRIENECNCDILTDEQSFSNHHHEEEMRQELRSNLGYRLALKGWQPVSTPLKKGGAIKSALPAWVRSSPNILRLAIGALLLALLVPAFFTPYTSFSSRSAYHIDNDREVLAKSLSTWTNSTNTDFSPVVQSLLPTESRPRYTNFFMILPPHRMAFSVAREACRPASELRSVTVVRSDDRDQAFNATKLAPCVYGITLPVDEAYGIINVTLTLQKPDMYVKGSHDFGRRAWQRTTYHKAGTDLTKAINKDVTAARKAAKTLADKVGVELSAGVAATQNVTTQLAVRMTRDVQLFANNAAEVFDKIASQSMDKVERISKDLAVARKDLIKRADDAKKSVATTAHSIKDLIVPSKKTLNSPLTSSRERARALQNAFVWKRWQKRAEKEEVEAESKDFLDAIQREARRVSKISEGVRQAFGRIEDFAAETKADECGKCKGKKACMKGCR